jgi:hypothetical protein
MLNLVEEKLEQMRGSTKHTDNLKNISTTISEEAYAIVMKLCKEFETNRCTVFRTIVHAFIQEYKEAELLKKCAEANLRKEQYGD